MAVSSNFLLISNFTIVFLIDQMNPVNDDVQHWTLQYHYYIRWLKLHKKRQAGPACTKNIVKQARWNTTKITTKK